MKLFLAVIVNLIGAPIMVVGFIFAWAECMFSVGRKKGFKVLAYIHGVRL